jgi:hypothetical protein
VKKGKKSLYSRQNTISIHRNTADTTTTRIQDEQERKKKCQVLSILNSLFSLSIALFPVIFPQIRFSIEVNATLNQMAPSPVQRRCIRWCEDEEKNFQGRGELEWNRAPEICPSFLHSFVFSLDKGVGRSLLSLCSASLATRSILVR